ncbi:MAG: transcriptional regulator [Devosia sp.]
MSEASNMSAALARAIEMMGGASATARALGVTPQAVAQWRRCPPARVLRLEALCAGHVSRHELRPDIYGAADTQPEVA